MNNEAINCWSDVKLSIVGFQEMNVLEKREI